MSDWTAIPPAGQLASDTPLGTDDRLLHGRGTGVATYARALHRAQVALSSRAVLISGGPNGGPDGRSTPGERVSRAVRSLWPMGVAARKVPDGFLRRDLFRLGQAFFTRHGRPMPVRVAGPPGIMHWCYPLPLHIAGWRNLYTVHDAIPLVHPELSPINGGRHARLLRAIAVKADALVTVSRAAKVEIAGALGFDGDRLVDCSQPVDVSGADAAPPGGLIPRGYLLVLGSIEPRKNVERIVAAYRASGVTLPLVVAGPDGWRTAPIAASMREAGVVRRPYGNRAETLALIAGARALVMPSLAEGFGLPVAEAMALGTPVITSATGALAETAGGAALLVDPLDVGAIAAATARITADDALADRLARAGLRRGADFSPAAFAERLRALYQRVLA